MANVHIHPEEKREIYEVKPEEKHVQTLLAVKIIYYVLGIIEFVLGFRFILKLLGANPLSGFVSFIYGISNILVAPFFNIFRTVVSRGNVVEAVLEPATIIAMLVYAFIAWGIVRLIDILITDHPRE